MPSHDQYERLHRALADTFGVEDIARLLDARFDLPLHLISRPGTAKEVVVSQVLDTAQRAGWFTKLVEAAHHARPDSSSLAELYEAVRPPVVPPKPRPVTEPTEPTLESLLAGTSITDARAWHARGVRAGRWVCRVEVERPRGTGLLVGPDAVLTCDHVLDDLLDGRDPHQFRFRFVADVRLGGGAPGPDDEVVGLAPEWLIDASPRRTTDITAPSEPDRLGYVLVRLARPVGNAPAAIGEPVRGWAWVPDAPNLPAPGADVVMLHYPFHDSLRISVGPRGLIGANADRTQLRYQLDTAPGSSGGPCFDRDWNLLAIHQGKVPSATSRTELWGLGIVATAIRAQLAKRGKADALGPRPAPAEPHG